MESVTAALNNGVRLIDTAYMYHNEPRRHQGGAPCPVESDGVQLA